MHNILYNSRPFVIVYLLHQIPIYRYSTPHSLISLTILMFYSWFMVLFAEYLTAYLATLSVLDTFFLPQTPLKPFYVSLIDYDRYIMKLFSFMCFKGMPSGLPALSSWNHPILCLGMGYLAWLNNSFEAWPKTEHPIVPRTHLHQPRCNSEPANILPPGSTLPKYNYRLYDVITT